MHWALLREMVHNELGDDPENIFASFDKQAFAAASLGQVHGARLKTGEEVAVLAGKFEPSVFASHIDAVGRWYNDAHVLVERNNHGHAVLLWLRDHSPLLWLPGHDGRAGWLSNSKGKALLRSVLPRVVDPELRADIEEALGTPASRYWVEG